MVSYENEYIKSDNGDDDNEHNRETNNENGDGSYEDSRTLEMGSTQVALAIMIMHVTVSMMIRKAIPMITTATVLEMSAKRMVMNAIMTLVKIMELIVSSRTMMSTA